jgi:hypothetical protein
MLIKIGYNIALKFAFPTAVDSMHTHRRQGNWNSLRFQLTFWSFSYRVDTVRLVFASGLASAAILPISRLLCAAA